MTKREPLKEGSRSESWIEKEGGKVRLPLIHYAPGKKLFQVLVKLSDAPGSYSSVLDILSTRVNLIGTSTYSLDDGTAIFSGVAEALSKKETAEGVKEVILSSKAAIEAEVREGEEGLLVDTFHQGAEVLGESYMLFSREGHRHMFSEVARMLGSGGEALLFNEGEMLGVMRGRHLASLLGVERFKEEASYLSHFVTARGWGKVEAEPGKAGPVTRIRVSDCFECSGGPSARKGCSFFRGYFTGIASILDGPGSVCTEARCTLRGAEACEFVISSPK